MSDRPHIPVLLDELVDAIDPREQETIIDCTFGYGGHSRAILKRLTDAGRLIAIDRDPNAISSGESAFAKEIDQGRLVLVPGTFSDIESIVAQVSPKTPISGIYADLGVSSPQLDQGDRGFSFQQDGPLDMRMNPEEQTETAADMVNHWPEQELANTFYQFGEETKSRLVARRIVEHRQEHPFTTTFELKHFLERIIHYPKKSRKHPATKVFQALRIAVNGELSELEQLLAKGFQLLKPGGRMAMITFHSLEDRRVKHFFRDQCKPKPLPRDIPILDHDRTTAHQPKGQPIVPQPHEIESNPRARSAKLRYVIKNGGDHHA